MKQISMNVLREGLQWKAPRCGGDLERKARPEENESEKRFGSEKNPEGHAKKMRARNGLGARKTPRGTPKKWERETAWERGVYTKVLSNCLKAVPAAWCSHNILYTASAMGKMWPLRCAISWMPRAA